MSETRVPLYRYPASYAREHGELEQYRASHQANCACRDMIEKEARENYQDNVLNTNAVLDTAVSEFGYERVLHVLAATLRSKDWDDRFSRENKAWAKCLGTQHPIAGGLGRGKSGGGNRARYTDKPKEASLSKKKHREKSRQRTGDGRVIRADRRPVRADPRPPQGGDAMRLDQ